MDTNQHEFFWAAAQTERGCGKAQPQHIFKVQVFCICQALRLGCDKAVLRHK